MNYRSLIKKQSKEVPWSRGEMMVKIYYLSRFKSGLRIMVTRFVESGNVKVDLVKGIMGTKKYKQIKSYMLGVPTSHQVDVAINSILSQLYDYVNSGNSLKDL